MQRQVTLRLILHFHMSWVTLVRVKGASVAASAEVTTAHPGVVAGVRRPTGPELWTRSV